MSCDCDIDPHPTAPAIAAGLRRLPRQVAGFPAFRRALLHSAGSDRFAAALGPWRASGTNDLGVMLLEMWAYLADSLAFYDEVHSHECFLRTARRELSVRDLVARLGYQPQPATAAVVELALLAEGRTLVSVPAGTAFRSSAFGSEPPQVFELDMPIAIHPLRNRWQVTPPRPITVDAPLGPGTITDSLWFDPRRSAKWTPGDVALVRTDTAEGGWKAVEVAASARSTVVAREPVDVVRFTEAVSFAAGTALEAVRWLRATKTARLWTRNTSPGVASPYLYLGGVFGDFAAGDRVVIRGAAAGSAGLGAFQLKSVSETTISVLVTGTDSALLPVTVLELDAAINASSRGASTLWSNAHRAELVVHYGFRDAGHLAAPPAAVLGTTAEIMLESAPEPLVDTQATRFLLRDAHEHAQGAHGSVDFSSPQLLPSSFDGARQPLTLPVSVFGNVALATRGESVRREVLGSGDATQACQVFELAKAPLTYVASPSAPRGLASTLGVWVDGRRWREVPNFFGCGPEDEIYVVELSETGQAQVSFGDGTLGKRLPTGTDNVVASYRFGAGASLPPAGSIAQVARGSKGLSAVVQPLAATGGSDAEAPSQVRASAPRRALTLGRAVSIRDMEAFASECAGVRAVGVAWAWTKSAQRPVIQVWVVGDGAEVAVRARLTAVSDPTTPIVVRTATSIPITLNLDVAVDAQFVASDVRRRVFEQLLGEQGSLRVEQVGVGRPVYFSRLLESAHAVPGVSSVKKLWLRAGVAVSGYGDAPGQGGYFSFDAGVTINGEVHDHG
jgi:hypothetical protein